MKTWTFKAVLEGYDEPGTWIFLNVPFDTQEVFKARSRIAVKGTINGVAFRSSLMPRGDGGHFLVVNKEMQKAAKATVGGTVLVAMESDASPRVLDIPSDLKEALARNGEAKAKFERLAYSYQKAYVDWVESAKRLETRQDRVAKTVAMVAEGKRLKG